MTLPPGQVTNILLGATLLIFVVVQAAGLTEAAAVVAGFIPARVTGLLPAMTDMPWLPVAVTPLSATLIHGGLLHIAFNGLMLVFCGRQVEQVVGRWPLVALYVVGAYVAAAAQWAGDPAATTPMIGASGAISAVMGTYALLYSRQNVRAIGRLSANAVRILWLAAAWIVLQLLIGVAMRPDMGGIGRIAVMAHIGGFVAGLLLTRPLLRWRFRAVARGRRPGA